ncbi:MAG: energy-converting hydrogenase B subunit J [Methanosphaera sp.]|jgi:energy-converting hydrogenase B subunit J|nr:energy-converting hydrogenase B subunit J [Methanosphaera sp.]
MVLETTVPFLQSIGPNLFGLAYIGPTVCAFIIGLIAGAIMHKTPTNGIKLNTSSWIAIIIGAILVAYWLGTFPYYGGLPLGPGFVMSVIGAIIGRGILGTKVKA